MALSGARLMGKTMADWKMLKAGLPTSLKLVKKQPLATKKYVKKEIHKNIENRYVLHYPSSEFGSISTIWVEHNLCEPTQGDTPSNRTGNEILIRSIEMKMIIQTGADELATDDATNVVRMILGLYTGPTNTPLADGGAGINEAYCKEIGTRGVLARKFLDKYIPLMITSTEKGAGDGYTPQIKQIKYYKYFKNGIKITYGDNTITYPNKRLILSMISDSSAITHPGIINGYIKVVFEDA